MLNQNKFSYIVLLVILAISTIISGCSNGESSGSSVKESNTAAKDDKGVKLGFSFGQSVHPFFIAMEKGARAAAKDLNVDLKVTSADYKLENQISNVEDLLQDGIDGLLLNPIDSKALSNVVNQANEKKIGVFTVDIGVVGADTTSFIASDNKEIGRTAARYVAEQLKGKGKIALIGWPTITSCKDREDGFLEEIAKSKGIKVVANQGAGMERAKSLEAAETILQANPDIDAFFGVNESAAMGALSAVQARDNKDIFILGVDATPDLLDSIKNNTAIKATVAQDPYQMGKIAVENAVKFVNGETPEKEIAVETSLVTSENVDEIIKREAAYK
ncbi:sugar ABC transporter substrate-binding protein [Bacillus canaveralius]|nr:sugar ABC transporter substrate-binding protein [Bacillus canaveralius]